MGRGRSFAFQGRKGERVTVRLDPDTWGAHSGRSAWLPLAGNGGLKTDGSPFPNAVTATLPRAETYDVTAAQLVLRTRGSPATTV